MQESLLSLIRILIFDLISIVSLMAIILAIFLPVVAIIEFIQLVRNARTASLWTIALRGRERIAAFRNAPLRPRFNLIPGRRIPEAAPESNKSA